MNPNWVVGLAGGGCGLQFSATGRATNGSGSGGDVGVPASGRWGQLYAMGVLAYGHFNDSENCNFIGLNIGPLENARGSFDSNLFGGRIAVQAAASKAGNSNGFRGAGRRATARR